MLLLVLTLGLSLFFLPPLLPIVAFFYSGLTVSGRRTARRACGRWTSKCACSGPARPSRSSTRPRMAVFFYLSWFFPPVFLVTLVDGEKRFLHDILSGVRGVAPALTRLHKKIYAEPFSRNPFRTSFGLSRAEERTA